MHDDKYIWGATTQLYRIKKMNTYTLAESIYLFCPDVCSVPYNACKL